MKFLKTFMFFAALCLLFSTEIVLAQGAPVINDVNAPAIHCADFSATYTVDITGSADIIYWEAEGAGWSVESSTTSNTFNAITAGPESGTISVWAENGSGMSNTFTLTKDQIGDPDAINVPGGFHCSDESLTYTVDAVHNADYYGWSVEGNGWTVSHSSSTWAEITGGDGDAAVSVWANNACVSSATYTELIVQKYDPDSIVAVNPGLHCPGSSKTYTISPVTGADSYSWYLESDYPGWSASSSTTTELVVSSGTATLAPATIYVAANNECGSSATISKTLDPFGPPEGLTANPPGSHCVGTSKTYTVIPLDYATSYSWTFSGSSGWTATLGSGESIIVSCGPATIGSATITVTASNACGTTRSYSKILTPTYTPIAPDSIRKPAHHCLGGRATYVATPVPNAESYSWQVEPAGWTGSSTTNEIELMSTSETATITVVAINDCGISSPRTINSTALTSPNNPTISGPDRICVTNSKTYTATQSVESTSYTWYLEGEGWDFAEVDDYFVVAPSATISASATITALAYNPCGESASITKIVEPAFHLPAPAKIYQPRHHCEGEVRPYACAPVEGATSYYWSISGTGWSGYSTTSYIDLQAGTGHAEISVVAINECGTSQERSISVTPGRIPAIPRGIDRPTVHCGGTTRIYSVSPVQGASDYVWQVYNKPNAEVPWELGSTLGEDVEVTAGSESATLTVYAANSCGTGNPLIVLVNPVTAPAKPDSIQGHERHCEGASQLYSIDEIDGANSYAWSVNGSGWTVGTSNTTEVEVTAGSGQGVLFVKAMNSCGESEERSLIIDPAELPAAPTTINKPSVHCRGYMEEYSVEPVPTATSYVWDVDGNNWTGESDSASIKITAGTGPGNISVYAVNSCGSGPEYSEEVISTPIPSSAFRVDRDTVCRDEFVTVTYTGGASRSAEFDWDFDGGDADPGTGRGPHQVMWYENPGAKTIKLIVTEDGCPSQENLVGVYVDDCVGVEDRSSASDKITLIPNPASGTVRIRINDAPADKAELEIVNSIGKVVHSLSLNGIGLNYEEDINLSDIESGAYFVKVRFDGVEMVKRLIIIK